MEEEQNQTVVEIGGKYYKLWIKDFDTEIYPEELLQVDWNNILGDLITFSVLFNRIGNLKAEMENEYNNAKMEFEIKKANLYEYYRKNLTKTETDTKGNEKVKKPTESEVENNVLLDKAYRQLKKKVINRKRDWDHIDALYWAAKSKDDKLNKITERISPNEFNKEILEGEINNVKIKQKKNVVE